MKTTASKKTTARQFWLAVHLYLGLALGLLMSVIGITGSLLVFYIQLDQWLNPELIISESTEPRQSYQALWKSLQASEPNRLHGWRLEIPDDKTSPITARYYKPEETEHHGFAPMMVAINPYTAEIINKRFWGQYLITWIYDLHYTLLLDTNGKLIMAIIGLLLTVSLLSGVYLWWPPLHKLKAALTIKRASSSQRFNYDLHKVAGIYTLLIMLMLALTGIALEVPNYINPAIHYFLPIDIQPPKLQSTPNSTLLTISADQAVATAQQLFPQTRLCWIETPDGPTGTYRINLRQDFEPSQRFPKTNIWIDQYSGKILLINDPKQQSSGTTLLSWLHPLHNGEVFGLTGQILVLVTGFACPLLFFTGVIRWLQKRRAKQKNRRD